MLGWPSGLNDSLLVATLRLERSARNDVGGGDSF